MTSRDTEGRPTAWRLFHRQYSRNPCRCQAITVSGLTITSADCQSIPQTREPNPQESVSNTQPQPMAAFESLEDYELLAEGKYLGVQRCAGSESLSNRREQREDDREHGIGKLYATPLKFNWFNENGVFGRDRITSCLGQSRLTE
jgi:hypothetical protein